MSGNILGRVATAMVAGLLGAPRTTRLFASTMTVVAGADTIHVAYQAAENRIAA